MSGDYTFAQAAAKTVMGPIESAIGKYVPGNGTLADKLAIQPAVAGPLKGLKESWKL